MSELHSTEWDFSGLSAAEIEACIRYELAREIQARDTYFGGEIDTREIRSMSDLDILISNENPHLFPGITSPVRDHVISLAWPPYFPLTPWQQIPQCRKATGCRAIQ